MASIIKTSINLDKIPKDKLVRGKKGTYLNLVVTINDDVDQFGNQGAVTVDQSKDDRDAGEAKIYLGNNKVVWTNGENVDPAPRDGGSTPSRPAPTKADEDDLPF